MMCAHASVRLHLVCDTDLGLSHVDTTCRRNISNHGLANGVLNSGVHTEALALIRPAAPPLSAHPEIASLAMLALGFIFVKSKNGSRAGSCCLQTLMGKAYLLSLVLVHAGLQDALNTTIDTLKAVEHLITRIVQSIVEVCAFPGTGDAILLRLEYRREGEDNGKTDVPRNLIPIQGQMRLDCL
ncbi:hypothetical protein B0H14DRAFT_2597746 [Mycena olivaceomarginata]|nr:hypothetical protein B0H14DRAFT_2597746 [Mycena olivaceomarginata]